MASAIMRDEDVVLDKKRLIGTNEDDFANIFVDGIIGFCLSVDSAILMIAGSTQTATAMSEPFGLTPYGTALALSALVCTFVLRVGQFSTDRLQTTAGKNIILAGYVASYALALICLGLGERTGTVVFAAIGLSFSMFVYARFLGCLTRRALMIVFDSAFLVCGLSLLTLSQFGSVYSFVTIVVASALSLMVGIIHLHRPFEYSEYVNIEDSKQRSVKIVGHNYTLFTIGFMLAPSVLMFDYTHQTDMAGFWIGASLAMAGIVSVLLERVDERTYKEAFKKNMALVAAVFLLFVPLAPAEFRLPLLSVYLCLVAINTIIMLNAVVETGRFNMISPLWLTGQEGSVFCAGAGAGCVLFVVCQLFSAAYPVAVNVACALSVIVVCFAQVHINYQVYPFEPQIDSFEDEDEDHRQTRELIEQSGNHKRTYQRKREYACEVFRLSPREREILQLLLKGRDAKFIMSEFYISQSTAKTHIYNIYRKFEVHSRQELLDFIENIELPEDDEYGDETFSADEKGFIRKV